MKTSPTPIPHSAFRIPNSSPFGLYLHVPFCAAKCPYCDFYSGRDLSLLPAYVQALTNELQTLSRVSPFVENGIGGREAASVYFGGGTPGLLPPETLAALLQTVFRRFRVLPGAEVTVEVNPTLKEKEAWFSAAAKAGVNRVSVGMQSAVAGELEALGRRGTPEEVRQTVAAARQAGVSDISLDIMLGVPGQTQETLQESLSFALSLRPTHLSVYILKLEPGTVFYKRKESLHLPTDDAVADLYLFACRYLKARGMRHYEISNFCFENRVGRHNLNYWRCGEYLGLGPAAHSYMNGRRFYFSRDLAAFIAGAPPVADGPGGGADEVFMLALRLDEGLVLQPFFGRFGLKPAKAFYEKCAVYQKAGLLTVSEDRLCLTENGFLVSNTLIAELLSAM